MKIRMKSNSLRLRLTQSELTAFCLKGTIQEEITFPNGSLIYRLKSIDDENISAQIQENSIEVFLPNHLKNIWPNPEQVGFSFELPLENKQILAITIEKDFKCLDERSEDESDNFPNPKSL